MVDSPDRRRFLQLTGTGVAASVAGCADLNPLSSDEPHADKVTAFVEPDMDVIDDLQQDLMEGEIDEAEVQGELEEIHEDAISTFEDLVESDDGLTVEESERLPGQMGEDIGIFLLDGDGDSLIAALQDSTVNQLLPGPTYEMVMEQQQQQQQLPDDDGLPEEGDEPDDGGDEGGDAGEDDNGSDDDGDDGDDDGGESDDGGE